MQADRARLGIDFGTSSTVAVVGQPDGQVRPLLFGESPILPSAVCLDWRAPQDGGAGFLVGRDAIHAGRAHPDAFEPNPKLRIDDGSVLLGPAELPIAELIGAVLRRVGTEAERVAGTPIGELTLTYPASWGPRRRSVLHEAALHAGLPAPSLVAEPVAAAAYFVNALAHAVPVGQCVVVYDFGAGTFDASVVARTGDGFTVLAEEGLRDAGGLDIDNAVVAYFGATYGVTNADAWRRLTSPQTPADRRTARHFWDDVRTGKEMLSRASSTAIFLPLVETDAILGREQLEHLARPLLDRTVTATAAAIRAAQVDAARIAGVFLVGGSSRIPLAATLLHRVLGIPPTIIEQPELVVAGGSLIAPVTTTAHLGPTSPAGAIGSPVAADAPATLGPPIAFGSPPAPVPPPMPEGSAAPVYSVPSADLPSTFEHPAPPPWETTPAGGDVWTPARGVAAVPPGAAPVSAVPISALPVSALPVDASQVSSLPVDASQVGASLVSAEPFSVAPVSPVPMSAAPVSAEPGSAAPVSAVPVSALPVSAAPVSPAVAPSPHVAPPSTAPESAWPPMAPPAEPEPESAEPQPAPAGATVVRGIGIAVVATALLRFALMFMDTQPSSIVLHVGFEPVFDYLALALLVTAGTWLIARPGRARPALAALAGFAPWALLPVVGDIGLLVGYTNWDDTYALMLPALMAQALALLAVAGLACREALKAGTVGRLLSLGLAAVAFWTVLAVMLWLTSGHVATVGSGQVFRVTLGLAAGPVILYTTAGARGWAGWTAGAWVGGALLWMAGVGATDRAEGMQAFPAVVVVVLLAATVALLAVRLRGGGAQRPHAGLAKGPSTVALGATVLAAVGFALVVWVLFQAWSYGAEPQTVARMFEYGLGFAVLAGGLLLLLVRRTAGAAAYAVGTAGGSISMLGNPDVVADLNWQLFAGIVLFGVVALVLAAVLIRSVPTRLSWPRLALALGCLLLLAWAMGTEPYSFLQDGDQVLLFVLFAAPAALVIWKGGMVTAGALLGAAAASAPVQHFAAYERVDAGPGLLLAFAVLAAVVAGFVLSRPTAERGLDVAG